MAERFSGTQTHTLSLAALSTIPVHLSLACLGDTRRGIIVYCAVWFAIKDFGRDCEERYVIVFCLVFVGRADIRTRRSDGNHIDSTMHSYGRYPFVDVTRPRAAEFRIVVEGETNIPFLLERFRPTLRARKQIEAEFHLICSRDFSRSTCNPKVRRHRSNCNPKVNRPGSNSNTKVRRP